MNILAFPLGQQESMFVREMVEHGDPRVAVVRSGLNQLLGMSVYDTATKIMERDDIRNAIAKGRKDKKWSQPIEITNRSIAEDLEHIYDMALEAGEDGRRDLKAAIWAKEAQAKMLGLLVSKTEVTIKKDVGEMSDEELQAIVRDHQKLIEGEASRVIDVDVEPRGAGGPGTFGPPES